MTTTEQLRTERVPTARLRPAPWNPRILRDARFKSLCASLQADPEFLDLRPILATADGTVYGGNQRLRAAMHLGWAEVPAIIADIPERLARERALKDNNAWGEWQEDDLAALVYDLGQQGAELELLGFDQKELIRLLDSVGALGEADDVVPEPPAEPITRPGDLWLLGPHRLLCGDATRPEDVRRLMGGQTADMLLTDPPYCSGGFQEAGKKAGSVGTRGTAMVANDTLSTRGYQSLMKSVLGIIPAGVAYVFTDWRMWVNLFDVVESCGYGVRNMIVWDKGSPGMGVGWRMQHELIMCGVRVSNPFSPHKAQGNVIGSNRTGNVNHPTEKPVDLLETIIDVTDAARSVCDPFAGSGSTLIAAHTLGRAWFGMELDPAYCDVIVQRWEHLTGDTARREAAEVGA